MIKRQSFLQTVQLRRFKAAFEPDSIPLTAFTVVVGRNGSGKSTLVEALQWLDTTFRRSAFEACDRYRGIGDLINKRSRERYFEIGLAWQGWDEASNQLRYTVRVGEESAGGNNRPLPAILEERLEVDSEAGAQILIASTERQRRIYRSGSDEPIVFDGSERLALPLGSNTEPAFKFLQSFWSRAVFLRLSPNQLAKDSPPRRSSIGPLLDEEGAMLPALLLELDEAQRAELVENLKSVLPDITDVKVQEPGGGEVHYSLFETMPKAGRKGRSKFEIPAWMLSEGTRRLTAIFALLAHDPPPSLLCIEEIENGLDPWTLLKVLRHLEAAALRGTQVILTTHSVWLLDECPISSILHVERSEGDTRYQRFLDRRAIKSFHASVPAGTRYVNENV